MARNLWSWLTRRNRPIRKATRFQPRFEELEGRLVPAAPVDIAFWATGHGVNQGQAYTLDGTVFLHQSAFFGNRIVEFEVDNGNGAGFVARTLPPDGVSAPMIFFEIPFQLLEVGTHYVSARATTSGYQDVGPEVVTRSYRLEVQNVLPWLTGSSLPSSVDEGQNFSLGLSAFEVGADRLRPTIYWGDGTSTALGFSDDPLGAVPGTRSWSIPKQYADNGTYTVTYRLEDDAGGVITGTLGTIQVANVAPTATFSGPASVSEGSTGLVSFTNAWDPSSTDRTAGYTYSFDFNNDGSFEIAGATSPSAVVPAAYLADGPGSRTVRGRITDRNGGSRDYWTTIAIVNVAPTPALLSISPTRVPGLPIDVMASAFDPAGAADPLTYDWTVTRDSVLVAAASGRDLTSFRFTPDEDGTYELMLTVSDDDGGSRSVQTTLSMSPFVASIDSVSGTMQEGEIITVTGSAIDPSVDPILTYGWSIYFESELAPFATGNGSQWSFAAGQFGTYRLELRASDQYGVSDTVSRIVTIGNVGPTTGGIPPLVVREDAAPIRIPLATYFVDPGEGGAGLTYTLEGVSDSSIFSAVEIDATGHLVLTLAPETFGAARVTVRGTDAGGLSAIADLDLTVLSVNDAPVRTAGTVQPLIVDEDSGITSLGLGAVDYGPGGGPDEAGQVLSYTVTAVPDSTLGDVLLADGTVVTQGMSLTLAQLRGVRFRTASDAFGSSAFRFRVQDNGGTANGANDSLDEVVLLTVRPVNDAPRVDGIADVTVLRDAAPVVLDLFAAFHDVDDASATLTFNVTGNSNPGLVRATVMSGSPATLQLAFTANSAGTSDITVRSTDPAGLWVETTFRVNVLAADLVGTSFRVIAAPTFWSDGVSFEYTLANLGPLAASGFDVDVRLSADTIIDSSDRLLATIHVGPLASGESASGSLRVMLPDGVAPATVYLGLILDSGRVVIEHDRLNNQGRGIGLDLGAVHVLGRIEQEDNGTFATANEVAANSINPANLSAASDVDVFRFEVASNGRLILQAGATPDSPLDARLRLYGPNHQLLATSDDRSRDDRTPAIDLHVEAGTYFIEVSASPAANEDARDGAYALMVGFTEALPPLDGLPTASEPVAIALGDFNRDGHMDVASADAAAGVVTVFFGLGDGSFRAGAALSTGSGQPVALVADDFDGDGLLDLVAASNSSRALSFFSGHGDGTFASAVTWMTDAPLRPGITDYEWTSLTSADLDGDTVPELVAGYKEKLEFNPFNFLSFNPFDVQKGGLVVFHRDDSGLFQEVSSQATGFVPRTLVARDVTDDGNVDLVAAMASGPALLQGEPIFGHVSVFAGNGDGSFAAPTSLFTGGTAAALDFSRVLAAATADFNADGLMDLAAIDQLRGDVSIFLAQSPGEFADPVHYPIAFGAISLVVADVNGDGITDLVSASPGDNSVSVLLGRGDGTFETGRRSAAGPLPALVAVADFNEDGHADLVTANRNASAQPATPGALGVLLGAGDGNFRTPTRFDVGRSPTLMVDADVNNDGILDLVVGNTGDHTVSVLLGIGNGTFTTAQRVGTELGNKLEMKGLAVADFNRDGRLDLAITLDGDLDSTQPDRLVIVLGLGDGTFREQETRTFEFGAASSDQGPASLASGDWNRDGITDLAVVHHATQSISLLIGQGDGTFREGSVLETDGVAASLVAGDFTGDGRLDLAASLPDSGRVRLFEGTGAGGFASGTDLELGGKPSALLVRDFDGDGIADLAVADRDATNVRLLLGRRSGALSVGPMLDVGFIPQGLGAGAFFSAGSTDLAVLGPDGQVAYLASPGKTGASALTVVAYDGHAASLAAGDWNGDGRSDIALGDIAGFVVPLLHSGSLPLVPATILAVDGVAATPVFADVNVDGILDVAIVTQDGDILLRRGQPGQPGSYQAPVVVNPGQPAQAIAFVGSGASLLLAAIDRAESSVTLYALGADGRGTPVGTLETGLFPTRIHAADLDGDGRQDLLVVNSVTGADPLEPHVLTGSLSIFLAGPGNRFTAAAVLPVHGGASEITLVSGAAGQPDIVVANRLSGDVSVFRNQGHGTFSDPEHYRAGNSVRQAGDYPLRSDSTDRALQSFEHTAGLVSGDFDGDGTVDLIALNAGSNALGILWGKGAGQYVDPEILGLGGNASVLRAGDLDADGRLDLVVLDRAQSRFTILLNRGEGHFTQFATVAAGNAANDFALRDSNGDGRLDLIVANQYGDVLILLGKGDGTFDAYRRTDDAIPLAVADLDGDGRDDFIFANQQLDHVTVRYSGTGDRLLDSSAPILGPGAVQRADLNGDGWGDLIVANSGSNNVLVYLGLSNGQFADAQTFVAGTNPTGITIADLNGDGRLDLVVANRGSNDLTVLLGAGTAADWTMTPGPRLQTGGTAPVSTVVKDVTGPGGQSDGILDLLVSNSGSNSVTVLPGTGGGFFNDQAPVPQGAPIAPGTSAPIVIAVGANPGALIEIITPTGPGLVVLNTGSRTLTELTNFSNNQFQSVRTFDTGGFNPVAILARDFNHDGYSDLLVANSNRDSLPEPGRAAIGNIVLLVGGSDGFEVEEVFEDPEMPHPSALALSSLHADSEFYATTEGVERAFPFFLRLPAAEPQAETTQLMPVPGSDVGFVPLLAPHAMELPTGPEQLPPQLPGASAQLPSAGKPAVPDFGGQDAEVLGNLELLQSVVGPKGSDDDWLVRLRAAIQEARVTWVPALVDNAAATWEAFVSAGEDLLQDLGLQAETTLQALGLDHLELPEIPLRQVGTSVVECLTGAAQSTWLALAPSQPTSQLQAAFKAMLPLADETPTLLGGSAIETSRELLQGLGEVLRSAVAPLSESGSLWADTADAVAPSRSVPGAAPEAEDNSWRAFWLSAAAVGFSSYLLRGSPEPERVGPAHLPRRHGRPIQST